MKKQFFLLVMTLVISFQGFSQRKQPLSFNKKGWQAWVTTLDGSKSERGFLWKIDGDSVYLAQSDAKKVESMNQVFPVTGFSIQNIESIELKKVKAGTKGMVLGMVIGYFTGLAISFSTEETTYGNPYYGLFGPSSGSRTTYDIDPLVGIYTGAVAGGAVGALIGSKSSKRFKISGSLEIYNKSIPELDRRAFWNRVKKK